MFTEEMTGILVIIIILMIAIAIAPLVIWSYCKKITNVIEDMYNNLLRIIDQQQTQINILQDTLKGTTNFQNYIYNNNEHKK